MFRLKTIFSFGWFGHLGSVGPNQVACRKDNYLTFSNILKRQKTKVIVIWILDVAMMPPNIKKKKING